MVPYDSRSPFQTSGIRIGTPAITTRGFNEQDMVIIAEFIDEVLNNYNKEDVLQNVKRKVAGFVEGYELFEW
jgi:glycine hydroxymethyltransferase